MRILCIDCEGPITKNDNALELCQHFLPDGGKFFSLVSKYDDCLADVIKREGYRAGTTLKFIVPFLKAYGVENNQVKDYSASHLLLLPGAKELLSQVQMEMPVFIISTSYSSYIEALCDAVNFPYENTYSTKIDFAKYFIPLKERKRLKIFYQEILNLPGIELEGVKSEEELSRGSKATLKKLDEILNKEIPSMRCGEILSQINPVGGEEKKKAIVDTLKKTKTNPSQVIYVGDSITDVEALKLVREGKGISLSFNGNRYALKAAEFALMSSHTFPIFLLAKRFNEKGKNEVEKLAQSWKENLSSCERKKLIYLKIETCFTKATEDNLSFLIGESEAMRKRVRGKEVGKLG